MSYYADPDSYGGHSLTTDAEGRLIRSEKDLVAGDRMTTRLRDGRIESIVERTSSSDDNGGT